MIGLVPPIKRGFKTTHVLPLLLLLFPPIASSLFLSLILLLENVGKQEIELKFRVTSYFPSASRVVIVLGWLR